MAELKIPERHTGGLIKLFSLSDKSIEEIISALEKARPKLFSVDLSMEVSSKVKEVPRSDIVEIIDTLVSLFFHGAHQDMPPEELTKEVVEAMEEARIGDLEFSKDKQELFRQRLIRFFKIQTLVVVAKALGVLQSNENNFLNARILTDIRPVFGSDASVPPKAAVIVHMLNLNYYHGSEFKEFYIAMDTLDIQKLREALDRAELKTQSLKSVIKTAGVTYLDPQE